MYHFLLLSLSVLVIQVAAHGRLTMPAPREGDVEDPDQPINFNGDGMDESERFPVNDPSNHPEGQSIVCRVNNERKTALKAVAAGGKLDLKWQFAAEADHPGDGGLYISYDADYTDTQEMRFFKIANFPQQRRDDNTVVSVSLPDWLPPGNAVLRWDWYATHNAPWTEFYANCVDIDITSSSKLVPDDVPSYKIEVGTSSANSYSPYNCESCWCFDCTANEWAAKGINGPKCVEGVQGNCCDLTQYSPVHYDASSGGGFKVCADKGNSGTAPWLDSGGGGGGGDPDEGGDENPEEGGAIWEEVIPMAIGGAIVLAFGGIVMMVLKWNRGRNKGPKKHSPFGRKMGSNVASKSKNYGVQMKGKKKSFV